MGMASTWPQLCALSGAAVLPCTPLGVHAVGMWRGSTMQHFDQCHCGACSDGSSVVLYACDVPGHAGKGLPCTRASIRSLTIRAVL
jgi:hypothetical protein